ncbi:MAG: hypothetical protein ACX932_03280 [Gammaproteobacteria bacterium]
MATEKKSRSSIKKTTKTSTTGLPSVYSNQLKKASQLEIALAKAEQQWEKHLHTLAQTAKKQTATAKAKLKALLAKEKEAEKKMIMAKNKAASSASKVAKNLVAKCQKQLKLAKQATQSAQKQVSLMEKSLTEAQEKVTHSKARKKALSTFKSEWRKTLQTLRQKAKEVTTAAAKKIKTVAEKKPTTKKAATPSSRSKTTSPAKKRHSQSSQSRSMPSSPATSNKPLPQQAPEQPSHGDHSPHSSAPLSQGKPKLGSNYGESFKNSSEDKKEKNT